MHISHFFFFLLMSFYLLFIFTFWTMEMMLEKKQIRAIFLSPKS